MADCGSYLFVKIKYDYDKGQENVSEHFIFQVNDFLSQQSDGIKKIYTNHETLL